MDNREEQDRMSQMVTRYRDDIIDYCQLRVELVFEATSGITCDRIEVNSLMGKDAYLRPCLN